MAKRVKTFKRYFETRFASGLFFTGIAILLLIATFLVGRLEVDRLVFEILFYCSFGFDVIAFISFFFFVRKSYDVVYNNLYLTTKRNYNAIYNEKSSLAKYSLAKFDEFEQLNNEISKVDGYYSTLTVVNKTSDYSNIPLEYYSINDGIVTEETFKKYIKEIIMCSQVFRNAIIRVSYNFGEDLKRNSFSKLYNTIRLIFDQEGLLIAPFDDKTGLYIYVPKLSSRSLLEENINTLITKSTITAKTINGTQLYSPKINAVIYPYSNIGDLFSDLTYAFHQVTTSSIYIPKRLSKQKNDSLLHSTVNLNAMNKIITDLSKIASVEQKNGKDLELIEGTLKDIINYIGIDQSGVVLLNDDLQSYHVVSYQTLDKYADPVFPVEDAFSDDLVEEIKNVSDADGSFFFSDRSQIGKNFGKLMDIYGINSGFFYSFTYDEGRHSAIIFFVNQGNKELFIDSYIRESLLVSSALISSIINVNVSYAKVRLMRSREDNLYKIAGVKSYSVNKKNYTILDFSSSLRSIIPDIQVGEKCYKAFFGLDKPCRNCPLLTSNKIIKEIGGVKSEISFSVNNRGSNQVELLINHVGEDELAHNRFEPDYGVNSIYALSERLESLYASKTRGYVVILTLDNISKIVKNSGNEGFLMMFRNFAENVTTNILQSNEIYLIKSDTFAIVLPEKGKLEAIDVMEAIHAASRNENMDEALHQTFDFAYNAIRFPQSYANPTDFIRNMEKLISHRDSKLLSTNTIYVEENDFYRPASRTEYILSIINDAVENEKFIIKAQPVVEKGGHIEGAELLIRLSDAYRDSMLNTDELIKIAGKYNKLDLISNILIKYICNAYQKYGTSLFKSKKFSYISINADYSYFVQGNFYKNLKTLLDENHIPRNFVSFEVNESDISAHYEEFQDIVQKLRRLDCKIVCDRYTGEFLSLQKLTSLDITEVKISRDLVKDVDVISEKYNTLRELLATMKLNKINPCAVGVENSQQYKRISALDSEVKMQGYYFFHPLDDREIVEAIKHDTLLN